MKMKALFSVTYEVVTPESAEAGEADERGYIAENVSLRDALKDVHATRTCHVDSPESIEADCSPMHRSRWVTVTNGAEFLTGAHESRSIHFPEGITAATARRLARLVGVRRG
jgi:hypothetical protein